MTIKFATPFTSADVQSAVEIKVVLTRADGHEDIYYVQRRATLRERLEEFMDQGGFPSVPSEDREKVLDVLEPLFRAARQCPDLWNALINGDASAISSGPDAPTDGFLSRVGEILGSVNEKS
ncbi:hypothetical protein SEA_BOBBY_97 [Mycobacterium phage Bobby]|nr:hypothetical protein SEA_BOBBY_97 [Mycobacterium phage Bobby]